MKQRLIDANVLKAIYEKWMSELDGMNPEHVDEGVTIFSCVCQLGDAPTIDPETLPIVQELRDEVKNLNAGIENMKKIVDEYAESARAIALWLSEYCDKTLSYPSMISNAVRKISVAYADVEKRAEQAEKERDEYKSALQNWHEGE